MKVLLTTMNAKFIHSSLAIRYLHYHCRSKGLDTEIREYTINNELLYILGDIHQASPDVLGLACYIWNSQAILELVGLVKKVLPQTVIILGDRKYLISRQRFCGSMRLWIISSKAKGKKYCSTACCVRQQRFS